MYCGVFIAKEVDGVGDKRQGDTTSGDVQTLEAFLNMSLRFACFIGEVFFSDKKQHLWPLDCSFQVPYYGISKLLFIG